MAESVAQPPKIEHSDTLESLSAEEDTLPTQDQAMDSIEDPTRSSGADGEEDDEVLTSDHELGAMVNGHHHEPEGTNGVAVDAENEEDLFGSGSGAEDAG